MQQEAAALQLPDGASGDEIYRAGWSQPQQLPPSLPAGLGQPGESGEDSPPCIRLRVCECERLCVCTQVWLPGSATLEGVLPC